MLFVYIKKVNEVSYVINSDMWIILGNCKDEIIYFNVFCFSCLLFFMFYKIIVLGLLI